MRYITVEDVIHTGIQTQITPDVQTHCLLVALINVVFFIIENWVLLSVI